MSYYKDKQIQDYETDGGYAGYDANGSPVQSIYTAEEGWIKWPESYPGTQEEEPVFQPSKNTCLHNWTQYTGLVESYEYCTKCDAKKHEMYPEPKHQQERGGK